ncbi:hypothetical protein IV203_009894 [Nitzschia inconspicua]|uniref:Uncharacterized protein n=1 Tax=Nitzschia inconspicua TaxID=303405 RepID=A0A9K3PMK9_9STRA|nr:hypothetical protein IV203_009894 [Nitzschia inconspicua]
MPVSKLSHHFLLLLWISAVVLGVVESSKAPFGASVPHLNTGNAFYHRHTGVSLIRDQPFEFLWSGNSRDRSIILRGGDAGGSSFNNSSKYVLDDPSPPFVRVVGTVTQVLISLGKIILPPTVAVVKGVVKFYRALPIDAITAQIGLVYCFLGGYYPTLFSALQAAQYCGIQVMIAALSDLTDEAIKVIEATADLDRDDMSRSDIFLRKTNIVLKTVDPMKINQAAAALYTTWLGVSAVLQREYARVISLSLTLASGFERIAHIILEPPLNLIIPEDYRKWVPAVNGWIAQGVALSLAWRIQRILTASTSAIAGGALFARSVLRMLNSRGITTFGDVRYDPDEAGLIENMIGFSVGSLGFYTQIECQVKNNFSFKVPFPLSLVTWPFDLAEKWIEWYITYN